MRKKNTHAKTCAQKLRKKTKVSRWHACQRSSRLSFDVGFLMWKINFRVKRKLLRSCFRTFHVIASRKQQHFMFWLPDLLNIFLEHVWNRTTCGRLSKLSTFTYKYTLLCSFGTRQIPTILKNRIYIETEYQKTTIMLMFCHHKSAWLKVIIPKEKVCLEGTIERQVLQTWIKLLFPIHFTLPCMLYRISTSFSHFSVQNKLQGNWTFK